MVSIMQRNVNDEYNSGDGDVVGGCRCVGHEWPAWGSAHKASGVTAILTYTRDKQTGQT